MTNETLREKWREQRRKWLEDPKNRQKDRRKAREYYYRVKLGQVRVQTKLPGMG